MKSLFPDLAESAYPIYHSGMYMEDFFYSFYQANLDSFSRTLIPVKWTAAYNMHIDVQNFIDSFCSGNHGPYFTISQHDDAVRERLPENTISFCAGGNSGGVPIPLVCSRLPAFSMPPDTCRDFLFSFVGSCTHDIRYRLYSKFKGRDGFYMKGWNGAGTQEDFKFFFNTSIRSKYMLCPRGYGPTSYRLYESMQLGCVPVYITDKEWLPYNENSIWDDLCIRVSEDEVDSIEEVLLSIPESRRVEMVAYGRWAYDNIFSMENLPKMILKYLQNYL
jgi:hypothetical protein